MSVERTRVIARCPAFVAAMWCALGLASFSANAQCERQHVQADVPRPNDWFGNTVAISGDWAAAGLYTDPTNGTRSGAVLMYHRNTSTGQWAQVQKIIPADNQAEDGFGTRIAMDGDVLVVSARWDDDAGSNAGSMYVYRLNVATNQWVFEAKRTASNASPSGDFGSCVDIKGDVIVIGAGGTGQQAQLAYVFERSPQGVWQEAAALQAEMPFPSDFGYAVGTDGVSVLVAGDRDEPYGNEEPVEWVDVFERAPNTGVWTRVQQLMNPSGQIGQGFGWTLDADTDTAVIGAARYDAGTFWLGAYAFHRDPKSGTWTYETRLDVTPAPPGGGFWLVRWVGVHDDTAVIGAAFPSVGASRAAVFNRDSQGDWTHATDVAASGEPSTTSKYAFSVAIGSDRIILGAPDIITPTNPNNGPGSVYFIDLNQSDCNLNSLCDDLDITGGTSNDINNNGIPDECEIQGDVNGDGHVDVNDLLAVITSWGPCPPAPAECDADIAPPFVGDNAVNVNDLLLVIINWGNSLP